MSGFNPAKKMMRTKREQAVQAEGINRQAINNLLIQMQDLREGEQKLLNYLAFLQREFLAVKQALLRRSYITELEIQREIREIAEMEKMESMALNVAGEGGASRDALEPEDLPIVESSEKLGS